MEWITNYELAVVCYVLGCILLGLTINAWWDADHAKPDTIDEQFDVRHD